MEKEQTKDAYEDGWFDRHKHKTIKNNEYYNETYKNTEKDMIRMAIHCWNTASKPVYGALYDVNKIAEEYIQFLLQPKMPVAFECEWTPMHPFEYTDEEHIKVKPKTTTNSQGQTEWVGKYIYEGGSNE